MSGAWIVFRFVLGLAAGSFINVLSLRYNPERPIFGKLIGGRSHCPHCGKTLAWYELIPLISFLLQKGRCRSCRARLSAQYPLVELVSGLIAAFLPLAIHNSFQVKFWAATGTPIFAYWLLLGIFALAAFALIFLSAVDFRLRIIPDQSNMLIAFLGAGVAAVKYFYGLFGELQGSFIGHYASLFGMRENAWMNHLAAAAIGVAFFAAIAILSRGRGMGWGDVKLAGAGGFLLGWPDAGLALLLAFILGAAGSILLMIGRRAGRKSLVPFGPFISLGFLLIIFFGKTLMDGYFALFP